MNYYNEFDTKAAAWLEALMSEGLIPPGHIDARSIADVGADDLAGYTQCHFFAGIGGWPLALQLAGWPSDRPVWTGSCPCQPFSVGNVWQGGGRGFADERHLWPAFLGLIQKHQPAVVFGEQVANAIQKSWLDRVLTDLEAEDYACGSAVLPACGYGADHERKRLWWGAHACGTGRQGHQSLQCLPLPTQTAQPLDGNPLARARRALDGDLRDLLHSNGVSLQVERDALKGYGNAIVPQVAAEFVVAFVESVLTVDTAIE